MNADASIARVKLPKKFAPLLKVRARYKGFYGGRGSAKSRSMATAIITEAAKFRPTKDDPDFRVLCCREIQRSMRESMKRLLDDQIAAMGVGHLFSSTDREIVGDNGAWFGFEGLRGNADTIRSYERIKRTLVEEAMTVSQNSLDTLIPTIRLLGSELWFVWNPRSNKDPVDRMFRDPEAVKEFSDVPMVGYDQWMVSERVFIEDNPWFPEVLRAEMERDKRRDPDRYAHIWLGEYARQSSARVFNNWEVGEITVPEKVRPYYGADWGFSIDPTVLVRCYILDNRRLYVDAEIAEVGCPIDKTPDLFDRLDPERPKVARGWPIKADSARPETIAYMVKHGYPQVSGARKGPGSVEEGIEFLKNYDIVVHPNCKRVIDELTLYSYETDKLTNEVLPKLADKDNHFIDALRYAVEDVRRTPKLAMPILVSAPHAPAFGDHPGW